MQRSLLAWMTMPIPAALFYTTFAAIFGVVALHHYVPDLYYPVARYIWLVICLLAYYNYGDPPGAPALHARQRPIRVAIEGNIGVGKSTLLDAVRESLAAELDTVVEVVTEPIETWQHVGGYNVLEHFYQDKSRFAFSFQSLALATRLINATRHVATTQPGVILYERSPLSDRLFAENCRDCGIMHPMEAAIYDQWWTCLVDTIPGCKPDGLVYLRTAPEQCYGRIKSRGRAEECAADAAGAADTVDAIEEKPGGDNMLNYLRALHARHDEWLNAKWVDAHEGLPVITIDASADYRTAAGGAQIAHIIAQFIRERLMQSAANCQ